MNIIELLTKVAPFIAGAIAVAIFSANLIIDWHERNLKKVLDLRNSAYDIIKPSFDDSIAKYHSLYMLSQLDQRYKWKYKHVIIITFCLVIISLSILVPVNYIKTYHFTAFLVPTFIFALIVGFIYFMIYRKFKINYFFGTYDYKEKHNHNMRFFQQSFDSVFNHERLGKAVFTPDPAFIIPAKFGMENTFSPKNSSLEEEPSPFVYVGILESNNTYISLYKNYSFGGSVDPETGEGEYEEDYYFVLRRLVTPAEKFWLKKIRYKEKLSYVPFMAQSPFINFSTRRFLVLTPSQLLRMDHSGYEKSLRKSNGQGSSYARWQQKVEESIAGKWNSVPEYSIIQASIEDKILSIMEDEKVKDMLSTRGSIYRKHVLSRFPYLKIRSDK